MSRVTCCTRSCVCVWLYICNTYVNVTEYIRVCKFTTAAYCSHHICPSSEDRAQKPFLLRLDMFLFSQRGTASSWFRNPGWWIVGKRLDFWVVEDTAEWVVRVFLDAGQKRQKIGGKGLAVPRLYVRAQGCMCCAVLNTL